ncbi:hypothetical protein D8L93_07170 [Sodalis-like symbiont of Bactericera trigonica]|nr:hypothetical protein D8L93_07170 [Sodalis-like symbiont of Bactericera trigonica]
MEPEIKIAEEIVQTEDNVVEMKKTKGANLTLISDAAKKKKKLTKLGSYIDKRHGGAGLILLSANKMR